MENDPTIRLQFKDTEVELHPDHTSVYHHLGQAAINHLFIRTSEVGEQPMVGYRIWRDLFGSNDEERDAKFGYVVQEMISRGYEAHINIQNPLESDVEAYVEWQMSDVDEAPTE